MATPSGRVQQVRLSLDPGLVRRLKREAESMRWTLSHYVELRCRHPFTRRAMREFRQALREAVTP